MSPASYDRAGRLVHAATRELIPLCADPRAVADFQQDRHGVLAATGLWAIGYGVFPTAANGHPSPQTR